MSRYCLLLLVAASGCFLQSEAVTEAQDPGPTLTFTLSNINGKKLPYTPGDTLTNPHALVTDVLTFDTYGYVDEVSTIRTIEHGDTTITIKKNTGMYDIEPPYVTIMWPHAGMVTYAFRGDSLWVPVTAVNELWMYHQRVTNGADMPKTLPSLSAFKSR